MTTRSFNTSMHDLSRFVDFFQIVLVSTCNCLCASRLKSEIVLGGSPCPMFFECAYDISHRVSNPVSKKALKWGQLSPPNRCGSFSPKTDAHERIRVEEHHPVKK